MPKQKGPLDGIRVIDMATVLAGPGSARLLADFGADVVKVEPPSGDPTRRLGWMVEGDPDSLFWKLVGRGKRSVVLNLKDDRDRDTMRALVDHADVLVENMRPGKLEALGLSPSTLHETNPRLVVLRVTGFGQTGPYSERPGFATIAEAMGGLAAISGSPEGPPQLPPVALTDEVTAMLGAFGIMVALWEARRSGNGQVIDLSLIDSILQLMGPLPSAYASLGYVQPRLGSGIPYTSPRGVYPCSDDVWVALSSSSDSVAMRAMDLIGVSDERFATFEGRSEHRSELEGLFADWIGRRPSYEVLEAFQAADAAIAPVYSMEDVLKDPHFEARHSFESVGGVLMQAVVPRLSRTPGSIRFPARPLGEDTDDVVAELTTAEIDESSIDE